MAKTRIQNKSNMHQPPKPATYLIILYCLALFPLYPLIVLITALTVKKRGGGWAFFLNRLGLVSKHLNKKPNQEQPIWFHAASVGEVNAIIPLVKKYLAHGHRVLITTNTPTGAQCIEQKIPDPTWAYLPIDFPFATQRFIKNHQPKQLIVMETELWLNLFRFANKHHCPVHIINGRLSSSTLKHGFLHPLWQACLMQTQQVLARNEQDAQGFKQLAPSHPHITIMGNIKYAFRAQPETPRLVHRAYWLAVSTHADEEWQITQAFFKSDSLKNDLLVIIPRHAERGQTLAQQLSQHVDVSCRSQQHPITDQTHIYLADTTGEAADFMPHALGTFVGGSLIDRGGHNVLEPARVGTPTATGPFTDNFTQEVNFLSQKGLMQIVQSAEELIQYWQLLKKSSTPNVDLKAQVKTVFEPYTTLIDDYYKVLNHHA